MSFSIRLAVSFLFFFFFLFGLDLVWFGVCDRVGCSRRLAVSRGSGSLSLSSTPRRPTPWVAVQLDGVHYQLDDVDFRLRRRDRLVVRFPVPQGDRHLVPGRPVHRPPLYAFLQPQGLPPFPLLSALRLGCCLLPLTRAVPALIPRTSELPSFADAGGR